MWTSDTWTYGAELEYADVRYGQPLPPGYQWNTKDYTIVNSSGRANDPQGKLSLFGGEINTRPAESPQQLVKEIMHCNELLDPAPVINYRSNLHIHVRVPHLHEDLDACKQLLRYITEQCPIIFPLIEPIPYPTTFDYPDPQAHAGALKRYKRRYRSHQYMVPQSRLTEMYHATTPQAFYEAHTVRGKNGKPLWIYAPRAAVNLRQLWEETNTIEFRHFPGTLDAHELRSCITWCREFLQAGLNHQRPAKQILDYFPWFQFPSFAPYNHRLETIYDKTNLAHHSRAVVKANIQQLEQEGVLVRESV